ncbi:MAG TPA: hypothetical protein VD813_02930, partial [Pseudonocardia sp.]|nr:hypothetical protein [Pseudonocardia sp.]
PATSAGTRPAPAVHPGAVAAARRHAVPLDPAVPRHVAEVLRPSDVVITVCDSAHEELAPAPEWMHWSVADPVRRGGEDAFDRTVAELARRVARVAPALHPADPPDAPVTPAEGGPRGHDLPAS